MADPERAMGPKSGNAGRKYGLAPNYKTELVTIKTYLMHGVKHIQATSFASNYNKAFLISECLV